MKKKHFYLYSLTFVIILSFFFVFNFENLRHFLRQNLPAETKIIIKKLFFGEKYLKEVEFYRKINYNQKALPDTEFIKIDLKKIELKELVEFSDIHYNKAVLNKKVITKKFFIDTFKNDLVISNVNGDIFFSNFSNVKNFKKVGSNIDMFNVYDVLDISIIDNYIFLSSSFKKEINKDCTFFQIIFADFNKENLEFKKFFNTDQCLKNTLGGRIAKLKDNSKNGILVTLGASETEGELAQKNDSPYGKILFFDLETKNYEIFSKGHRNPQGLIVDEENIISTEHGPYGGDEINQILQGKNYGYPISSYGDSYDFKKVMIKIEIINLKKVIKSLIL